MPLKHLGQSKERIRFAKRSLMGLKLETHWSSCCGACLKLTGMISKFIDIKNYTVYNYYFTDSARISRCITASAW